MIGENWGRWKKDKSFSKNWGRKWKFGNKRGNFVLEIGKERKSWEKGRKFFLKIEKNIYYLTIKKCQIIKTDLDVFNLSEYLK